MTGDQTSRGQGDRSHAPGTAADLTAPPVGDSEAGDRAGAAVAGRAGQQRAPRNRRRRSDRHGDPQQSVSSFVRELPVLVVVAVVLAFLLRTFVVQVFYIPSSSMEPTLQVNDRILVDKVSYNLRDLHRGEIVVFEGDPSSIPTADDDPVETVLRGLGQLVGVAPANARDFVKRVVGLPGDRIRIDRQGAVYVNGQRLDEAYVGKADPQPCGPLVVPEGRLFFLGDNRNNSSDSRSSLGFVPRERVVGRALLVLWPPDRVHLLDSPDYRPIPPGDATPPEPSATSTVSSPCAA